MDERQDQFPQPDQYQTQQIPQPPTWGAPPPQAPGGYYAPPAPVPPVKARPRWKTPLIAAVALVVGIAIGAAAGGGSKNDNGSSTASGSTSTGAASSAPSSAAPGHSAAAAAAHSAPAAPAKNVVLQTSGNGQKTTKTFTVASSWSVKYTYDCTDFGMQGNFAVSENGGEMNGLPIINALGKKGSDTTYQHDDAGQRSLEVDSECNWTLTVTSGDAG